jgi:very-short-patch-repair endonuclease
MLWEEEMVVVEYDGIVHLTEERRRSDAVRRNLLQDAGYLVIVFTARDLKHPEAMCATVMSALRRRPSR